VIDKVLVFNLSIEPRPYQTQAVEWALARQQAVCSLPTGTGKTLVAVLWLKSLFEQGQIKNALILEPTRLLVNQTSDYLFYKAGIESVLIDGRIPRTKRAELWQSEVVVATPETTFNDIDLAHFDAIVVDECHHTVGQDAFAKVMQELHPTYRLGLSAFIPARREREVTELIGPIRRWSWNDPEIEDYVPNWIGEVYEANLSSQELELLKVIRQLAQGNHLNPALLERYLTRDGSVAVRETLTKKNRLAEAFGDALLPVVPDRMHKLEAVNQILDSHEPRKAIIFVDRVLIADKVGTLFPQMQPVVFKGKRGKFDQGAALHQARNEETKLVASTSAGEEGIDLPSADLLIIWGNAASDIRFIQRLGRMMRKTGEGLKFATFVVTPESSDLDSFALGLAKAAEAGTIDVEKTFGWDPEVLWPRTTWWHVSESLRGHPTALPSLEKQLSVRGSLADKVIGHATKRGRVFYLYDVAQMATDIVRWYLRWDSKRPEFAAIQERMLSLSNEFQGVLDAVGLSRRLALLLGTADKGLRESLRDRMYRRLKKFSVRAPTEPEEQQRARRIYLLTEDADRAVDLIPTQLADGRTSDDFAATIVSPIERGRSGGLKKGLSQILDGFRDWQLKPEEAGDYWATQIKLGWKSEYLGYEIGYRSIVLDFYYYPVSEHVFTATVANMNRLLLYRDVFEVALNSCSQCHGQGAELVRETYQMLCLKCWSPVGGEPPASLVQFGQPVAC